MDFFKKVPFTHCHTQCPQHCSRPPLTHASAKDSWTLMGKSGSVSCGVTAPFSWFLVCTRFCLCPPRVCVSSCGSLVGLMVTSSKRTYCVPKSAAPRAPVPVAVHCFPPYQVAIACLLLFTALPLLREYLPSVPCGFFFWQPQSGLLEQLHSQMSPVRIS